MIGGFQPVAFQPAYQQVSSTPVGIGGGGGGGGGHLWYKPSKGKDARKALNEMLDKVVAEVMYKDLIATPDAPAAAKIVRPLSDDRQSAIPKLVDWQAVQEDATKVGQLFEMWSKLEAIKRRKRQLEEEWFMLGD